MNCFPIDQLEKMFLVAGLIGSIVTFGFCLVITYIANSTKKNKKD